MILLYLEINLIRNTRQKYQHLTTEELEEWMKLILWAAEEEVAFKEEAELITSEDADMATEEDFMVDVEEETNMAEEAGITRDINDPDPMP